MKQIILLFLILFCLVTVGDVVFAMDSAAYRIAPDVLNESGGTSDSANYRLFTNLGESPTGASDSAAYRIHAGFLQADNPYISFTVSDNSLDFGVLSTGAVSTRDTTLTISTNAMFGYSVDAYDDTSVGIAYGMVNGANKIADATTPNVYINLPLAGVEHYGITVTGTHAAAGYAGGTKINSLDNTNRTEIGSYTSYIAGDTITVQYRASISNISEADNGYRTTTTFICTGEF